MPTIVGHTKQQGDSGVVLLVVRSAPKSEAREGGYHALRVW